MTYDMHLIFDFDDTLTDTTRYWNFWLDQICAVGVSRDEATQAGTELFAQAFTWERHLDALNVDSSTKKYLLVAIQNHIRSQGPTYIFSDVYPFLSQHKQDHTFSLLTYGDPENQQWRIAQSGIGHFFEPIRVAGPQKYKVDFLKEILEMITTPLVFVDDSPNELNPVVDAGLPIKLYRIVRPSAKHDYVHERDGVAWKRIDLIDEISLVNE